MIQKRFISFGVCFAIVMAFFLYNSGTSSALECRVIKVNPARSQPVSLEPETLSVAAGDCVVWVNASRQIIKVTFLGSGDMCASPTGFIKAKECFKTFLKDLLKVDCCSLWCLWISYIHPSFIVWTIPIRVRYFNNSLSATNVLM